MRHLSWSVRAAVRGRPRWAVLAVMLVALVIVAPGATTGEIEGPVDLGTLGGALSQASAVNDSGQVAGTSETADGSQHPFSWTPDGGMVDLGTLGGSFGEASSMNDHGQVGGDGLLAGDETTHAWYWPGSGPIQDIGTLGGSNSVVAALHGLNDAGQMTGWGQTAGDATIHAYVWSHAAGMTDLGTLGGPTSNGEAINAHGEVVGVSDLTDGEQHAFVWTASGGMVDLGTLGGSYSEALAVSDTGWVAGLSRVPGDAVIHAVVWRPDHTIVDLGTLPNPFTGGDDQVSTATDVNDSGQVVGNSYVADGELHAFSWTQAGGMLDLNTLPDEVASSSEAVTNGGQVIGDSIVNVGGDPASAANRAWVWTPGGSVVDLGTFGGSQSTAVAASDSGYVAGFSVSAGSDTGHAARWQLAVNPEAGISITPQTATDTTGGTSTFTISVAAVDRPLDPGTYTATASILQDTASTSFVGGNTCTYTDTSPSCTVVVTHAAPGAGTIHASTTVSVAGQSLSPATQTDANAHAGGSGDAVFAVDPIDEVSGTVAAGGSVGTANDPSPSDPVRTLVVSPNAGTVAIAEEPVTGTPPVGFAFAGVEDVITAPPATPEDPLSLEFTLDATLLPAGVDYSNVSVFRDGAAVAPCDGSGAASPDPCVASRSPFHSSSGIGATLVVLTSHASVWNFGAPVAAFHDTPPVIGRLPGNTTKEATGPYGVHFTFSVSVQDRDDGGWFSCTGGTLTPFPFPAAPISYTVTAPVGVTTVTCTATDAGGDKASPKAFTLTVTDHTPPGITVPADVTTNATSPSGATVTYPPATAVDLVDGAVPVSCTPASGSLFKNGRTGVACSATDAHGNKAVKTFAVTVLSANDQLVTLAASVARAPELTPAVRVRLLLDLGQAALPNTAKACQGLTQFVSDVGAYTSPAGPISSVDSASWLTAAAAIRPARGC